jgi:hypothetical protein
LGGGVPRLSQFGGTSIQVCLTRTCVSSQGGTRGVVKLATRVAARKMSTESWRRQHMIRGLSLGLDELEH